MMAIWHYSYAMFGKVIYEIMIYYFAAGDDAQWAKKLYFFEDFRAM